MRWGEVGGMEVAGVEAIGGDESRVSLVVALVLDAVDGLGGDLSVIPGQREHRRVAMEGARWGRCEVGLCGDSVDGGA